MDNRIKYKNNLNMYIVIIGIFLITIFIVIKEKKDDNTNNTNNTVVTSENAEKKYVIEDFENYSFKNVEIIIENGVSYINIDIINTKNQRISEREVVIYLYGKNTKTQLQYTIPDLNANSSYNMKLNVIEDLSDIQSIKIMTK